APAGIGRHTEAGFSLAATQETGVGEVQVVVKLCNDAVLPPEALLAECAWRSGEIRGSTHSGQNAAAGYVDIPAWIRGQADAEIIGSPAEKSRRVNGGPSGIQAGDKHIGAAAEPLLSRVLHGEVGCGGGAAHEGMPRRIETDAAA